MYFLGKVYKLKSSSIFYFDLRINNNTNLLKRKIITTADGSTTIYLPDWNEQYHSRHGAIQEAEHVFIKMGLEYWRNSHSAKEISILEIGFGTGLNALVTWKVTRDMKIEVDYTGIEAYPVSSDEIENLNYAALINKKGAAHFFKEIHCSPWEQRSKISNGFSLVKKKLFFQDIAFTETFDLVYFDAFGAQVQPELWTVEIFKKMYYALKITGVLVTYSAKGSVRRALIEVGFKVERVPGPPGKREMLRATKI